MRRNPVKQNPQALKAIARLEAMRSEASKHEAQALDRLNDQQAKQGAWLMRAFPALALFLSLR